jgi:hypothetical protein
MQARTKKGLASIKNTLSKSINLIALPKKEKPQFKIRSQNVSNFNKNSSLLDLSISNLNDSAVRNKTISEINRSYSRATVKKKKTEENCY